MRLLIISNKTDSVLDKCGEFSPRGTKQKGRRGRGKGVRGERRGRGLKPPSWHWLSETVF